MLGKVIRRKRGKVCASRGRTKEDHFFGTHANQSPLKTEAPSLATKKQPYSSVQLRPKAGLFYVAPTLEYFIKNVINLINSSGPVNTKTLDM